MSLLRDWYPFSDVMTPSLTSLHLFCLCQANEAEAASKENARLKAAAKVSEQRVKSALQDQMTLHHQIQVRLHPSLCSPSTHAYDTYMNTYEKLLQVLTALY